MFADDTEVGPNKDFSAQSEWLIDEAVPISGVLLNTSRPSVHSVEVVSWWVLIVNIVILPLFLSALFILRYTISYNTIYKK